MKENKQFPSPVVHHLPLEPADTYACEWKEETIAETRASIFFVKHPHT